MNSSKHALNLNQNTIMLRTSMLMLFLLGIATTALSQKTPFRYMAKSSTASEEDLMQKGEAYEKVAEIYDKLVAARGDRRFDPPTLYVSPAEGNIAFFSEDGMSIAIEQKAFDYCKSLGEDKFESALASLLAHELMHFYEKHLWSTSFASEYSDLEVGMTINKIQDRVIYETQADYLGGFLAYSAGYDIFADLPTFIGGVYKEYWGDKVQEMEGYPSLDDRKALAGRSVKKLNEFVELFEMANIMTAIGRYDDARAFYRHILGEYQSSTIYNNLGIVTILEAIGHFEKKDNQLYRMPLELDLRFSIGGRGFGGEEKWRALVKEAIRYFDYAIGMDETYAPAYLNKACGYFLLKDFGKAKFYAGTEAIGKANAQKDIFTKTIVDADILLALITYEENANETTKQVAIDALKAIVDKEANNSVAAYNLAVLEGTGVPKPGTGGRGPSGVEVDGIEDLKVFVENNEFDSNVEKELSSGHLFRKWEGDKFKLNQSVVYYCKPPRGSSLKTPIKVQLAATDYEGRLPGGIKKGSLKADILAKYKAPKMTRNLPNGEIIIYNELILILDEKGALQRWAVYY